MFFPEKSASTAVGGVIHLFLKTRYMAATGSVLVASITGLVVAT
jgi:hypothetical protein